MFPYFSKNQKHTSTTMAFINLRSTVGSLVVHAMNTMPSKHTCSRGLQFTTTLSTGLLAGGAVYTLFVENPAMMTHDPSLAATVWKPSFTRAERLQNVLLLTSSVTQLMAYAMGESGGGGGGGASYNP